LDTCSGFAGNGGGGFDFRFSFSRKTSRALRAGEALCTFGFSI